MNRGRMPYGEMLPFQAATGVANGSLKLDVPSQCPKEFAVVLERCWAFEAQERPKMQEIYDELAKCIV